MVNDLWANRFCKISINIIVFLQSLNESSIYSISRSNSRHSIAVWLIVFTCSVAADRKAMLNNCYILNIDENQSILM